MDRALREALEASEKGRAYLAKQKAEKKARASRVRARPGVRAEAEKKRAKREERNDRTAEIRAECEKRADGKCELCEQPAHPSWPLEMHHLLSGRGRRTQEQAVENCIMICPMCHAVGHGRILYAGPGLLAWAQRHGYAEAEANVRRRIDKALIADPTWPRDEDETRRLGPQRIDP